MGDVLCLMQRQLVPDFSLRGGSDSSSFLNFVECGVCEPLLLLSAYLACRMGQREEQVSGRAAESRMAIRHRLKTNGTRRQVGAQISSSPLTALGAWSVFSRAAEQPQEVSAPRVC